MNRVATISMQQTLVDAMQRTQRQLANSEAQLSSGKKAQSLSDLGINLVPALSARSLLAQQDAYTGVTKQLDTTLSLYNANISSLDAVGGSLQQSIVNALGQGNSAGLQSAIDHAFTDVRSALNAQIIGVPLFGGGQSGDPFTPQTLADTIGMTPEQAFANGNVKASARVADNTNLTYGVTASDLGRGLLTAFQTLASVGPIESTPTAAQTAALQAAASQIKTALIDIRGINASNGHNQAQVTALATRAQERSTTLQALISDNEDADLSQVATQISQQQTLLQASYSVFSRISQLNLLSFLPAG